MLWAHSTGVAHRELTGHAGGVTAVALGRAGDRDVIVSGSWDGTVRVWDVATGSPLGQPLTGHTGPVTAVALGRAGDRDVIVSGSWDETVRVWDAATGSPLGEPLAGHTGGVTAVALGRAGDHDLIVSGSWDGTVRVWDAATGEPRSAEDLAGPVRTCALASGLLLAAVGTSICVFRHSGAARQPVP